MSDFNGPKCSVCEDDSWNGSGFEISNKETRYFYECDCGNKLYEDENHLDYELIHHRNYLINTRQT